MATPIWSFDPRENTTVWGSINCLNRHLNLLVCTGALWTFIVVCQLHFITYCCKIRSTISSSSRRLRCISTLPGGWSTVGPRGIIIVYWRKLLSAARESFWFLSSGNQCLASPFSGSFAQFSLEAKPAEPRWRRVDESHFVSPRVLCNTTRALWSAGVRP